MLPLPLNRQTPVTYLFRVSISRSRRLQPLTLTVWKQTEMLAARRGSGVWFNRRDSKSRVPSLAPGVRIPPSPPLLIRYARADKFSTPPMTAIRARALVPPWH